MHLYNWLCPLVGWSGNEFVRRSTRRTLLALLALFSFYLSSLERGGSKWWHRYDQDMRLSSFSFGRRFWFKVYIFKQSESILSDTHIDCLICLPFSAQLLFLFNLSTPFSFFISPTVLAVLIPFSYYFSSLLSLSYSCMYFQSLVSLVSLSVPFFSRVLRDFIGYFSVRLWFHPSIRPFVRPSVYTFVCPSITLVDLPRCRCSRQSAPLASSITAPTHFHATKVAMYLALFFIFSLIYSHFCITFHISLSQVYPSLKQPRDLAPYFGALTMAKKNRTLFISTITWRCIYDLWSMIFDLSRWTKFQLENSRSYVN